MNNIPQVPKKVIGFDNLIAQIPESLALKVFSNKTITHEEHLFLKEIKIGAEKTSSPLLPGLRAIGQLLGSTEEEIPLDVSRDIGWLISSLADQLEKLTLLSKNSTYLLEKAKQENTSPIKLEEAA